MHCSHAEPRFADLAVPRWWREQEVLTLDRNLTAYASFGSLLFFVSLELSLSRVTFWKENPQLIVDKPIPPRETRGYETLPHRR